MLPTMSRVEITLGKEIVALVLDCWRKLADNGIGFPGFLVYNACGGDVGLIALAPATITTAFSGLTPTLAVCFWNVCLSTTGRSRGSDSQYGLQKSKRSRGRQFFLG